jgi:AcrR family transcriptional regulator
MLDAAREMLAAKGFAATTREIADRATVTEQLLFNHFESKQQLFTVAVLRPFEERLNTWQAVLDGGDQPRRMMRLRPRHGATDLVGSGLGASSSRDVQGVARRNDPSGVLRKR